MIKVWVIETGDYEERHVVGVAATVEAGVSWIKALHGRPHEVRWDDLTGDGPLVGHFSSVPGFSTEHDAEFAFTAFALLEEEEGT